MARFIPEQIRRNNAPQGLLLHDRVRSCDPEDGGAEGNIIDLSPLYEAARVCWDSGEKTWVPLTGALRIVRVAASAARAERKAL